MGTHSWEPSLGDPIRGTTSGSLQWTPLVGSPQAEPPSGAPTERPAQGEPSGVPHGQTSLDDPIGCTTSSRRPRGQLRDTLRGTLSALQKRTPSGDPHIGPAQGEPVGGTPSGELRKGTRQLGNRRGLAQGYRSARKHQGETLRGSLQGHRWCPTGVRFQGFAPRGQPRGPKMESSLGGSLQGMLTQGFQPGGPPKG